MGIGAALATAVYRAAASVAARMLSGSPAVESVLVHRSVATREIVFGRSDIDLVMVIRPEVNYDGAALASLYRHITRVQKINPALNHIDVYERDGMARHVRVDTCLGSTERRSCVLLAGRPVEFPVMPVEPDHAVARFALWAEWFFAVAVQQRSRRNIRKTALEAWNAYAVAEGLISEPYLRRSDMEAHVRTVEGDAAADGLGEPEHAVAFVLSLADRLHRTRLPELRPLAEPLLFETIIAPLGMRRLFAVLPRADTPLPPEVFERPGVFPCTPQLLNLHMNFKSAFLSWAVPQQLRDLGMTLPGVGQFLRHSRAFNDDRFLRHPGFAMRHHPGPWVVTSCIRHALASAERGEVPKPITPEQLEAMMTGISSMEDYYRTRYADLRREVESVRESLEARLSWPLGQRSG